MDKHKRHNQPLYLGFVDLQLTEDTVHWPPVWGVLQRLGVGCHMLGAV